MTNIPIIYGFASWNDDISSSVYKAFGLGAKSFSFVYLLVLCADFYNEA